MAVESGDEQSMESLNKEYPAVSGFSEEDETPEDAISTPTAPSSSAHKVLKPENVEKVRGNAQDLVVKSDLAAFVKHEPKEMHLGECLGRLGLNSVTQGSSHLWFKGDGPDSGNWLFIMAAKGSGPSQPGYRVLLGFGAEKAGSLSIEACALLEAQDRNGKSLKFVECCTIKQEGGTIIAPSKIKEAELRGMIEAIKFGKSPFIGEVR